MTAAEILVIRHLHPDIYKSEGGGQATVFSRHTSGPRGFANACQALGRERGDARLSYGVIGAGAGYLEVVPKGGAPGEGVRIDIVSTFAGLIPVGADLEWWQERNE